MSLYGDRMKSLWLWLFFVSTGLAQESAPETRPEANEQEEASTESSKPSESDELNSRLKNDDALLHKKQEQWLKENLERYLKSSEKIVIGKIVDFQYLKTNQGKDLEIEVEVSEWIFGKGNHRERFIVPYNAPYRDGKPETVPPVIVESYKMLIFVNKYDSVLEGNALFVVEGGKAFRNKRPTVFLNPRHDRDWVENMVFDEDYLMYELDNIRSSVKTTKKKKCFFFEVLGF